MDTPTSPSEEAPGQAADLTDRDAPPIWSILRDIDAALGPYMGGVRPEMLEDGLRYGMPLGAISVRINAESRLFIVHCEGRNEAHERMTADGKTMLSWVVGAVTEQRFARLLERFQEPDGGRSDNRTKELERTIAGETPPPAGESWPELFEGDAGE